MGISELFAVSIDFDQSHLFFPRIIHWLLLIMLVTIVLTRGIPYLRAVRSGTRSLPFTDGPFDGPRFFGTIVLTMVYFIAMQYVGEQFPNTGYGFLFMSIPYMFALSVLYLHERDFRHLSMAAINALLAPIIAWYILAEIFYITLP
jgi:hypothetical protein